MLKLREGWKIATNCWNKSSPVDTQASPRVEIGSNRSATYGARSDSKVRGDPAKIPYASSSSIAPINWRLGRKYDP